MASYTIVAIPSESSETWKVSSEKVPHLTLMFLGEHLGNVKQVETFIGHVVDTSLRSFSLEVKNRGVLGDKSADVLFFGKYGIKTLSNVRSYFLNNDDIFKAYNSTDQFPQWTPHLTLGYPETPANPDKRDYPGIHSVSFDKIALWTGDYEGVEFPLKPYDDELSMSDKGAAFIEHVGVKGMKWGVRRAEKAEQRRSSMSDDARTADDAISKAKTSGVHVTSNRELQNAINRMNLEQQYDRLRPRSGREKATRFIAQQLLGIGKEHAQRYARDQVAEAIKKAKASS